MSKDEIQNNDSKDLEELRDIIFSNDEELPSANSNDMVKGFVRKDNLNDTVLHELFENNNVDTNNDEIDENELSAKYDEGYFDNDASQDGSIDNNVEQVSEFDEKRLFFAALYLSGKPISLSIFRKMFSHINLENRLISYSEEFNKLNMGLQIRMVADGYQVVTSPDIVSHLEKRFGERTELLSKPALETAAIIAYKQPITRAEVAEVRGLDSSGPMRVLLDRNLIKVVGKKDVPGKPLLFATTKQFLEYFGLQDLSGLPSFKQWQEMQDN